MEKFSLSFFLFFFYYILILTKMMILKSQKRQNIEKYLQLKIDLSISFSF